MHDLDDKYVECYYEALSNYDITDMQGFYFDKKRFLKILYEEKIKNYQFDDQGDFIDMLSSMGEDDLNDYTSMQLQRIGKYVEMCCVNGTYKSHDFVKKRNIWTENLNFAKGVAIEGFTDEKGNLCVSRKHIEYVLPVLWRIKNENRMKVIDALDKLPVVDTMNETMLGKMIRAEVKKYFDEESEECKALMAVVNKYCVE